MNLSGVIVEALRVYGDNMLQFLQVNDLDSSRELKRVGEVVWHKRFDLGWKDDWKNRWVRQGLDLGPLLAAQKDGMFQIRVTFRVADIRYVCPDEPRLQEPDLPRRQGRRPATTASTASGTSPRSGRAATTTTTSTRTIPSIPPTTCPPTDHDITIRRNVVVSDIGAAMKREADGTWHVAGERPAQRQAPRGRDGHPLQLPAAAASPAAQTGARASCSLKRRGRSRTSPRCSRDRRRAGSRSTRARPSSVGHFDIGGEKADSGLKGFIYGERGVWRPGDAMHLSFILYDRTGKLPAKYPIAFELEDPLGRVVRTGTYTDSVNGFYSIDAGTAQDAPTGTYVARVKAGGRTFTKNLKVETVMPNRLKIDLSWGATRARPAPVPISRPTPTTMSLAAAWLTGAKAGALKADVSATFAAAGTSFTTLPDYTFDDPTRTVADDRVVLFDDRPRAATAAPASASTSPRRARACLRASSRPTSSRASSSPRASSRARSTSVDFHPYERYVGLRLPKGDAARGMLLVDKDQRVDLALVDRDGKLVKGGRHRSTWPSISSSGAGGGRRATRASRSARTSSSSGRSRRAR